MTPLIPMLLAMALVLFPVTTGRKRLMRSLGRTRRPPVITTISARFSGMGKLRRGRTDSLALAAGWDLLAAATRAGIPVPFALAAVAEQLDSGARTGTAAASVREVADLLALGQDPVSAWEPARHHPETVELAQAARRTARAGSGLAEVAAEMAAQARARSTQRAHARAQRAGVWVSAPLGLCFLPAFLCLGIVPVVVGMAQRVAEMW